MKDKLFFSILVVLVIALFIGVMGFSYYQAKSNDRVDSNFLLDGKYTFEMIGKYYSVKEDENSIMVGGVPIIDTVYTDRYNLVINMKVNDDIKQPYLIRVTKEDYSNIEVSKDFIGVLESDIKGCKERKDYTVDCAMHIKLGTHFYDVIPYKANLESNEYYKDGLWVNSLYKPQK